MIKYYCDICEKEVTRDTGIIETGEITAYTKENDNLSISIELNNNKGFKDQKPSICFDCLSKSFGKWTNIK